MRTYTETKTVYTFDELPRSVQVDVMQNYRMNDEFPWERDWAESLDAFCEWLCVKGVTYEYGCRGAYISFTTCSLTPPDGFEEFVMRGVRLWKWLQTNLEVPKNSCPFTGYCGDEDLLEPLRSFLEDPRTQPTSVTMSELVQKCLERWLSCASMDLDYWDSEECIIEEIKANEHEFTENGELV